MLRQWAGEYNSGIGGHFGVKVKISVEIYWNLLSILGDPRDMDTTRNPIVSTNLNSQGVLETELKIKEPAWI